MAGQTAVLGADHPDTRFTQAVLDWATRVESEEEEEEGEEEEEEQETIADRIRKRRRRWSSRSR